MFQLGHVFSDMDSSTATASAAASSATRFNWATSFQTWIGFDDEMEAAKAYDKFQLGHVFSDMDSNVNKTIEFF